MSYQGSQSGRRRGMTMVELLLALALLSGLTLACVSWTTLTVRALAVDGVRAAWKAAAERSLDLIDRALAVEDRSFEGSRRERWTIQVKGDSVVMRTRQAVTGDQGRSVVCGLLRLQLTTGLVWVEYLDDKEGVVASRPLLGEVAAIEASSEELEDHRTLLTLRVVHEGGATVERCWRLPEEGVR